jgi:hypothetical protein
MPNVWSAARSERIARSRGRNAAFVLVFAMGDDSTRRVYRPYDFAKSQAITPGRYYACPRKLTAPINSISLSSLSSRTINTHGIPLLQFLPMARKGPLSADGFAARKNSNVVDCELRRMSQGMVHRYTRTVARQPITASPARPRTPLKRFSISAGTRSTSPLLNVSSNCAAGAAGSHSTYSKETRFPRSQTVSPLVKRVFGQFPFPG